jgi:hypothetical protein
MSDRQLHRRQVPLWKIAPFLLVPSALVAGASLYWNLPLTAFITTFALTCLTLILLFVRTPDRQLAVSAAEPLAPYQKRRQD